MDFWSRELEGWSSCLRHLHSHMHLCDVIFRKDQCCSRCIKKRKFFFLMKEAWCYNHTDVSSILFLKRHVQEEEKAEELCVNAKYSCESQFNFFVTVYIFVCIWWIWAPIGHFFPPFATAVWWIHPCFRCVVTSDPPKNFPSYVTSCKCGCLTDSECAKCCTAGSIHLRVSCSVFACKWHYCSKWCLKQATPLQGSVYQLSTE